MKHFPAILTVLLALAAFYACESVPEQIAQNLSAAELVQRAQDAADNYYWKTALKYYQAILERFPQELGHVYEARYEIAFIQYKQEQYAQALASFKALLADFDKLEPTADVPSWPRGLSKKMVSKIEALIAPPAPATSTAPASSPAR